MSLPDFTRTSVLAHEDFIETIHFCPDGARLLTAGRHGGVKVWDLTKRTLLGKFKPKKVQIFERHVGNFRDIVVTPDGRLAIAYGANWTEVWNLETGRLFLDLKKGDEEYQLLAKDGRLMVTEASWCHGGMRLWDLQKGMALATLKLQKEKISPSYHPAMEGMTQDEIDLHTPSAMITEVMLIGDDRLAVVNENLKTFVFDLQSHQLVTVLPHGLIAVHPNGQFGFAASSSETLSVIDLRGDQEVIAELDRAIGHFGKIATTSGGHLATTRGNDLMIWRMDDWKCVQMAENVHAGGDAANADGVRIDGLLILSDGACLATFSREDPLPRLFELGTAGALHPQTEKTTDHAGIQQLLAYPGGGMVTRSASGVRLWDGSNGARTFGAKLHCSSMDVAQNGLVAFADGAELVVMKPGG